MNTENTELVELEPEAEPIAHRQLDELNLEVLAGYLALGLDGNAVYRIAQDRMGDVSAWELSHWSTFAEQLETVGSWFNGDGEDVPF